MEIKTQDVYIPANDKSGGWIAVKIIQEKGDMFDGMYIGKYTDMIVMAKQEFEKAIADAKAEELKRIRDNDRKVDEWCNLAK